jgi:cysteine synthase
MTTLLSHPYLLSMLPPYRRPIHLSAPLPKSLNPYAVKDVMIQLALAHGEMRSIKEIVALNIVVAKINSSQLRPGDTAIDATSGNTGRAYAGILQTLGIKLRLIVQGSLPAGKLGQLRVYGEGVEIIPHYGPESTVERARREAAECGYVLLDQYGSEANPEAHELYTAPELCSVATGHVAAIVCALGTCGTSIGLSRFSRLRGRGIKIIGVAVDPDNSDGKVPQIPGMRTITEIERDVRLPWRDALDEIRFATRRAAIRASRRLAYAEPSWPGLSTGAAYDQALAYVSENVDSLRGKRVIIISPDSIEPYVDIMNAEQDDADIGKALSSRPEF